MANTLRVALAGIVLASVLGVVVGLMRLSHHPLLAGLGAAFVEVFRNVPLLIQLLAIYLLITELLPEASSAIVGRGRRAAVEGRPADRGARSRSALRCCTR